jgi:transcriptional regulator with XRE-family HTH domain
MGHILGIPKLTSQGIPKFKNVRLAYMNTWNKRITIAREAAGFSKTKLALEVGVSNATVSDWESGVIKKLEGENLLKICEKLQISPRWLQFGEGEMSEKYKDHKIQAVLTAMQNLPEYKKDILVQTSTALAEQSKSNGSEKQ